MMHPNHQQNQGSDDGFDESEVVGLSDEAVLSDGTAEGQAVESGQDCDNAVQATSEDQLIERLDLLVTPLADQIRALNDRASHRESIIDRLHADNDLLRAQQEQKHLEPIVASLVRVLGHMEDAWKRCEANPDVTISPGLLQGFVFEIEDVLDSCGLQRFRPTDGEPFDSKLHQIRGRVDVAVEAAHNTIQQVEADGFMYRDSDRAFQRAAISVGRYDRELAVAAEVPLGDIGALTDGDADGESVARPLRPDPTMDSTSGPGESGVVE